MYSAHGRILALTLASVAMATGKAEASSISGATTTPTSTSATPVVTTLSTDFSTGTFDGWAVTDHTAGYGVAKDGTTVGGTYDVFGTMKVNAQNGDMAAYAVVSTINNQYLGLTKTVDLAPGQYEIGYYLGANSSARPVGANAFSADGNGIAVNGVPLPLMSHAGIPNGSTPSDFGLYKAVFATAGGPTRIDLKITGSGFGEALLSIGSIYLHPLTPSGQTVPEPTTDRKSVV